ncbi:Maf family protein [Paenibacillus radicis (ex Xue et al. 2023)]|uniref:dTTP/UTP pyrophosphatase n=1 Tax=Paenibacillus radicis (ex Xue et al. 2023) TaxID=2972489 RepID=A0ABT1Y8S4_9BACL|nr:Maf family protein [Paenibacillus radicis (ex Xue et al. 2023)]MCR8629596.1 Maf family protein [Paenibacillus radicis (ex Xue et al. 2023)]
MSIIVERKLILASSSPRRQELIRTLQLPYEIRVSDVNEDTEPGLTPAEIVEQLSGRKAAAVCEMYKSELSKECVVIGSDTIVVLDGQVLGKPKDRQDASRMLNALQGREHQVFSGVACLDLSSGTQLVDHQVTSVYMKPLSDEQIERYILTGEPMDKAGSYAIQGLGATIVERIEGDYFNVVGLPMSLLSDLLKRLGIAVL